VSSSRIKAGLETLAPFQGTHIRTDDRSEFVRFPNMLMAAQFVKYFQLEEVAFACVASEHADRRRFDVRVVVELVRRR